jgi:LSD1 subclass zinc finger protein
MNPIYKFNNGRGAMLCNGCRTIISTGPKTKEILCDKCKQKNHIIEIMNSDEELGLYNDIVDEKGNIVGFVKRNK